MENLNADPYVEDIYYLEVIEMLLKLRKLNRQPLKKQYESNKHEAAMRSIFWKTVREIADQEINKDNTQMENMALNKFLMDFDECPKDKLWLPMHFALSVPNIDLEDIQILFDNHHPRVEGTCWDKISDGGYLDFFSPYQLAVMMKDPNMALIERLSLKFYDPEYCQLLEGDYSQSIRDDSPLHLAAEYSNSVAVIQKLILLHPPALVMGIHPPLYRALENTSPQAPEILTALIVGGSVVGPAANWANLPFHQCLKVSSLHERALEMASILLEAYPEAINIPDHEGNLPIHIAAEHSTTEVFKMVYQANPACLLLSTEVVEDNVAHCAARGGKLETLCFIHDIVPEMIFAIRNERQQTPLAVAVGWQKHNPNFIKRVIALAPEAVKFSDSDGNTLLHTRSIFGEFSIQNSTLRLLLRLIPGGALATNHEGLTPYDILDTLHQENENNNRYDCPRRLLLLAGAPSLHPETRKQMNYQARKGALLAFFAPRRPDRNDNKKGPKDICSRLHNGEGSFELIRHIIGFI